MAKASGGKGITSKAITCKVITPQGVVFEGEVASVKAPGYEGGFQLLPRHAPYMVRLETGAMLLLGEDGAELFTLDIDGGFLSIAGNECTILIEGVQ